MAGFNIESAKISLPQNIFIEASAGTGKTYAITTLILRLLIEKGMRLDQILVVTFTRLATLELKTRLREMIKYTYALVEKKQEGPEYLLPYLKREESRIALLRILKGALALMDMAKIMTIHGFSAYVINLDRNEDFSEESVASSEHLKRIIKDFLRTELVASDIALWQQELLLSHYRGDFDALISGLGSFALKRVPIECGPTCEQRLLSIRKKMASLRGENLVEKWKMQAPFYKGACTKSHEIKENILEECKKFERIVYEDEENFQFKDIFCFLPENRLKKHQHVQPLYTDLLRELQELNDPMVIFAMMAERVRCYVSQVVAKEGLFFYDDLVLEASRIVQKKNIQETIEEEFSFALIDEFQDTDASQWQIFSTLFLKKGRLVVVGDPKQSIYRFRLADLYTYMKAKEDFSLHLTLTVNYRSGPNLVRDLHDFFAPAKKFLVLPERNESFPCPRVAAKPFEGEDNSALHLWLVESEEQLFALVAKEIIYLHKEKGIQLSDCALLVKDRHQLKRLQKAFARFSLPLLTVKEETIAQSPSFNIFIELLESLLEPHDLSKNGKVLLSPLFALTLDALTEAQQELLPYFFTWSQLLKERGLLLAIREVVAYCAAQLFSHKEGLRIYDDIIQLVEYAEEQFVTPEQLLHFYRNMSSEEKDLLQPRPITTEDAVIAMTIHMSKGLEFAVVFPIGIIAPFTMRRELVYSSTKGAYSLADGSEEHNAEKMRLLYVALTRAKRYLYIPYIAGDRGLDGRSAAIDVLINQRPFEETMSFVGHEVEVPIFAEQSKPTLTFTKVDLAENQQREIHSFSALFPHKMKIKAAATPSFPLGSEVGTLLHLLLEKISFQRVSKKNIEEQITPLLRNTLLTDFIDPVAESLHKMLHTPLEGLFGPFFLSEITLMQKEVVFINIKEKEGSKGVIDLFFAHQGRYYFLDWKSNFLETYSKESMQEEMVRAHYYEQARLYKDAIREYLRLFDQRPFDDLFGGFFYIFLRGPGFIYGR